MNKILNQINQQIIFKELKVGGDCWCNAYEVEAKLVGIITGRITVYICSNCGEIQEPSFEGNNPDFTTEVGAFWLLKRLPKWNRFEEFCTSRISKIQLHEPIFASYVFMASIAFLAFAAKDGKAPALYNALCEFMKLEEEG